MPTFKGDKVIAAEKNQSLSSSLQEHFQQAVEAAALDQQQHDQATLNHMVDTWDHLLQRRDLPSSSIAFRLRVLHKAGKAHLTRYHRTGQAKDLDAAVRLWQKAANLSTSGDAERWVHLTNLGVGLEERYLYTGRRKDLDVCIGAFEEAANLMVADAARLPLALSNLGTALKERFSLGGSPDDLDRAIGCFAAATQLPSVDDDRATYLSNFGLALRTRAIHNNKVADLDQAIVLLTEAERLTAATPRERIAILHNLGLVLSDRYDRTKSWEDLERALESVHQAVILADAYPANLPLFLTTLGALRRARYEHAGDSVDLEDAIEAYTQAITQAAPGSPHRQMGLSNLSDALRVRYERAGNIDDIEQALMYLQSVLRETPPHAPARPIYLGNRAQLLRTRYDHTGRLSDLYRAIQTDQTAITLLPPHSEKQAEYLAHLGAALQEHFERTGKQADHVESAPIFAAPSKEYSLIQQMEQAVTQMPPHAPARPTALNNLGLALYERYERQGAPADLDAALLRFGEALAETMPTAPIRQLLLNNRSAALHRRYERGGNLADLEEAIRLSEQLLIQTPPKVPGRAKNQSNLGLFWQERAIRTGMLDDLEAALQAHQEAVRQLLPGSPDRRIYLNNLANGLWIRFHLRETVADLKQAVHVWRHVLASTPPDSPDRPMYLDNLGTGLRAYAAHSRYSKQFLKQALDTSQEALRLVAPDAPERWLYLSHLGMVWWERFLLTREQSGLETAIHLYQDAARQGAAYAPKLPSILANLGAAWAAHFALTDQDASWRQAVASWRKARTLLQQMFVDSPVAYKLGQQDLWTQAYEGMISGYLEYMTLRPSSAAAARRQALEITEEGKSRLLTQLVGWGAMQPPPELPPSLLASEQALLAELTALDTAELSAIDRLHVLPRTPERSRDRGQRQKVAQALEERWKEMLQAAPEAADYVALRRGKTPTWRAFARLAEEVGPATALISCAVIADRLVLFLLRSGWRAPRVLEMPSGQIGWKNLLACFSQEIHGPQPVLSAGDTAISTDRSDASQRFFSTVSRPMPDLLLVETWATALRLLLEQAQEQFAAAERLILAPASGGHRLPWAVLLQRAAWRTPPGNPLPLVTLPALGVLTRLRRRPRISGGSVLVIGNPCGDLPYAEAEAIQVAERFGSKPLLGAAATRDEVLSRLSDAWLVHLATHAFFHAAAPLESGIRLADGILTAREILAYRLQVDLLVLSACESGQAGFLGGEELAGLSQAFLQAGVRSLLVSLWRVDDPATAALMQAFYVAWQAGADKAVALRQAMTVIQRDTRWEAPYYWGAFVLLGDWV